MTPDRRLRACIVAAHALPGVRAGSALLRVAGRLLAVQDDAWRVAWIDLPSLAVTAQVLRGDGGALAKADKPDFEAALVAPDGSIRLLGSGSTARRCALVRIAAGGDRVDIEARPDLYAAVRAALALAAAPNIEAAIIVQDRLRLFHRGTGEAASASVDFPLAALDGGPARAGASRELALGHLDGIPLHLTDAATAGRGRVAFLAAAEDTPDAVADGPIAGSAIGLIEPTGAARWTPVLDARGRADTRKLEGLVLDADRRGAWALSDPDAADRPAELCRITLDGFA